MTRQWVKALAEQKRAQREAATKLRLEKERAADLEQSIFERELEGLWKAVCSAAGSVAGEFNAIFGSEEILVRADESGVLSIDRRESPRKVVRLTLKAPSHQIAVQQEMGGVGTHPGDVELLVADGHLRIRSQELKGGAKLTGEEFAEELMRRFLAAV